MKVCGVVPCRLTSQVGFANRSRAGAGVLCSRHRWDRHALRQDEDNDVPSAFTYLCKISSMNCAPIWLWINAEGWARCTAWFDLDSRYCRNHSSFDGRPTLHIDIDTCPGTTSL
jgi:hypothetical protein